MTFASLVYSLVLAATLQVPPPESLRGSSGTLYLDFAAGPVGAQIYADPAYPSINAKLGDSSTAMFRVFNSGNVELFRVDAVGRLTARGATPRGVMTLSGASADARLVLTGEEFYQAGNTSDHGVALLLGVNRTNNRQLWVIDSEAMQNTNAAALRIYTGANGYVDLSSLTIAAGAKNLSLQNGGGNVGIGTPVPSSRLQVAGDLRIGSNSTNTDVRIFTDNPAALSGYTQINTITPVTIPSTGTTKTALYLKNASATGQGTNQIDLHVAGDIVAGGNIAAKFQDVAEWVPATEDLAPGTVVILDPSAANRVKASNRAYDTTVAGVVSTQPGIILGEAGASKEQIATTGRVLVSVDATAAAIRIGDLLVTSAIPGVAMKSEPLDLGGRKLHQPGTIIGKALEPLESGRGQILVLLSLQ